MGFSLPPGRHVDVRRPRGYYIDLSVKAQAAVWPPPWFPRPQEHLSIALAQWGLGCYERYIAGEGDEWLAAANEAAQFLSRRQIRSGRMDGAWLEHKPYRHTFRVRPPWASAMGQGEAASLLVRVYLETGEERLADAARRALLPLSVPTSEGGVQAILGGRPWPEEYPTTPPSFVLNGGIFALWGYYDVAIGLGDDDAPNAFSEGVETLATNLHRWDTGYWTRYDLYPHPVMNVASPSYHRLHIDQLRAVHRIAHQPELVAAVERYERYAASSLNRTRALAHKVAFRLLVPRNRVLARMLPWGRITA